MIINDRFECNLGQYFYVPIYSNIHFCRVLHIASVVEQNEAPFIGNKILHFLMRQTADF